MCPGSLLVATWSIAVTARPSPLPARLALRRWMPNATWPHCPPPPRSPPFFRRPPMPNTTDTPPSDQLPVIIIGAGPVGLAAAAHVLERGLTPVVLEAGASVGAAIAQWGHTRLFSPGEYNIDDAARRLPAPPRAAAPGPQVLPTAHELLAACVTPLAEALGDRIRPGARVVAASRDGMDKTRSAHRADTPLLVRITTAGGAEEDLTAQA